ncbi:restriction endonuclease [Nannocystis punicea]|uniref:Restriction endonuclease n=1 Tax=Nannocystis punicea TaxID=2995304 RepID=A0ABY7HGG3_9BACT|nr:restriction endonuclease [Nannocystis poenicansa]WAS97989.1 restriction endonuclease [Nannocystis poenicansa]
MKERRAQRIERLLREMGGRARTGDLAARLREDEGNDELSSGAIYVAVNNANRQAEASGERKRFHTYREGEQRGWIRLETGSQYPRGSAAKSIEESIYEANHKLDEQLRQRLARMSWRTFESNFLRAVLEALGFQDVVITQASRDGGYDATAAYRRGLVDAQALVSAKHWARPVSVEEVRMMRGIKGPQDTAIIVTTSTFTQDARNEAKPGQNQRVVYLIDGETLVRICKEHQIGVRYAQLPQLSILAEEQFGDARTENVGTDEDEDEDYYEEEEEEDDDEEEEEEEDEAEELAPAPRLYASLLGNEEKGLSVDEIAKLLKLSPLTVRNYLSVPERRKGLADRIREDPKLRERALKYMLKRQAAALADDDDADDEEEELEEELLEEDDDADDTDDATEEAEDDPYQRRHLRETMLGDSERGLSIDEIAKLLKLSPVTVRAYLGDERRKKDLADRIRQDPKLRLRALRLIERRRTQ